MGLEVVKNPVVQFLEDNFSSIFLGFAIPIVIFLAKMLVSKVALCIRINSRSFSYSGLWVSCFYSLDENEKPIREYPVIELFRIKEQKNGLKVNIQHYSSIKKSPDILRGFGIFTLNKVAILYRSIQTNSTQIGTISLKVQNKSSKTKMVGTFYEDGEADKCEARYPDNKYILYRIKDNYIKELQLLLNRIVFKDYEEAHQFY